MKCADCSYKAFQATLSRQLETTDFLSCISQYSSADTQLLYKYCSHNAEWGHRPYAQLSLSTAVRLPRRSCAPPSPPLQRTSLVVARASLAVAARISRRCRAPLSPSHAPLSPSTRASLAAAVHLSRRRTRLPRRRRAPLSPSPCASLVVAVRLSRRHRAPLSPPSTRKLCLTAKAFGVDLLSKPPPPRS